MSDTMFSELLDFAAETAVSVFQVSGAYFYEDRSTGERLALAGEIQPPAETPLDFVSIDPTDGVTIVRKGKGFLVTRPAKEAIDAWRLSIGRDIKSSPTPAGGDYIVKIWGGTMYKYEIDRKEPCMTIASNEAVCQINTVLSTVNDEPVSTP